MGYYDKFKPNLLTFCINRRSTARSSMMKRWACPKASYHFVLLAKLLNNKRNLECGVTKVKCKLWNWNTFLKTLESILTRNLANKKYKNASCIHIRCSIYHSVSFSSIYVYSAEQTFNLQRFCNMQVDNNFMRIKNLEVVCSVDTQLGRRRQISFLHSVIYKMIFILNVTPFTPIGVMLPNLSSTLSKSKHHKNTPLSCIYFVPIFSCKLLLFMLPF